MSYVHSTGTEFVFDHGMLDPKKLIAQIDGYAEPGQPWTAPASGQPIR